MRFLLISFLILVLIPSVNAVWVADSTINSSFVSGIANVAPSPFLMDGTWYMLAGDSDGNIRGYNWTGAAWQADQHINASLTSTPSDSKPYVFFMDGTLYTLIGDGFNNIIRGYNWTGAAWQADQHINASLPSINIPSPKPFFVDGTLYMIVGSGGAIKGKGFNYTGTVWQADAAINDSFTGARDPHVFLKDGTRYIIGGLQNGRFNGFNWTGSSWQADDAINASLPDISAFAKPFIFEMDGELFLLTGGNIAGLAGFKWNESTTLDVTMVFPSTSTTTNTSVELNATSTDSDMTFYWYNGSSFVISSETPTNDTRLVGAWHLGEGEGNSWISNQNISDYSIYGGDGEIFGAEYVRGRFEKGMEFDGAYSFINIPDTTYLNISNDEFTLSAWIYPIEFSNYRYIISKDDTAQRGWSLHLNVAGSVVVELANASTYTSGALGTVTLNRWSHLVATYDGSVISLYINGSLSNSRTHVGNLRQAAEDVEIGRRGDGSYEFNGTIDEVRIYNRSLSATEILDNYNLGLGYYNWTHADIETTYTMLVNASDSYANATASSSLIIDYTWVTLLNETDGALLDEDMNIKIFNFDTFEELNTTVGRNVTYKDIDNFVGIKIAVRASNTSSTNFTVPREIAKYYTAGTDFILYLPKTSVDTVGFHQFKIRDLTEDWGGANVIFKRDISGTLTTIHETFVDVENKAVVYLIKDIEYQITVNKSDDTRVFGFYKATHSSTTTVLEVELNMINITEWTDRAYLNKDINFTTWINGTNIFFGYDNVGTTWTLEWWVFNGSNRSQQLYYTSANGSATALFTYGPPDPNETHFSYFCANNSIFGVFCKWDTPRASFSAWGSLIGPRMPTWAPTAIAMSILLVIAGLFGGIDSKTGTIVLAGSCVFFWYIGWLDLGSQTQGVAILGLVVFMAVLNKMTEGAQ